MNKLKKPKPLKLTIQDYFTHEAFRVKMLLRAKRTGKLIDGTN